MYIGKSRILKNFSIQEMKPYNLIQRILQRNYLVSVLLNSMTIHKFQDQKFKKEIIDIGKSDR